MMKKALQIIALAIVLTGVGVWLGKGLNLGWTKTAKSVMQTDPVTEIVYPTYKQGFYPGVDFLAATLLTGLGLWGASFAMSRKRRIHLS